MSAESGSNRYAIVFLRWLVVPLLLLGATLASAQQAQQAMKVGVYNFSPLVFIDDQEQVKGLFVDVLEVVAKQEGWKLEYVPGTWQENLSRLETGEIDLLMSIASSEARLKQFDFTQQHLFLDWGIVYRQKGAGIETIFDLTGKNIGVLKGSIYTTEFKKLLDQFGIQAKFIEKSEYREIFKALSARELDAGINANVSGLQLEGAYPVERTTILFAPTKIRFAVKKGNNGLLLDKLDTHFQAMYADKTSVYYDLHRKWTGLNGQSGTLPGWILWAVAGLVAALSLFVFTSIFLKRLVSKKTADLRESEENLAITLHSIGDAVIATDPTGRVTRMNSTAERLSGWTLADAMGRPLAEVFRIINAATRKPVADPVQLVMAQGQVVGLVNHTVLLAKDGQEYQIADSAAPIRNAGGEIVGVVLVFSDVTERYRAEQALRAGERRFRSYFDQPMIGIAITSPEKGWIEANEHLCKMLGYGNDELVRLTWAEFTHPDDLGADVIQFERVLRGEIDGYALDKRFIRKDQSVIPVFLSVRCVREVDGSVDYFVALLQDITARKQAEKALRQSETHYRTMFASAPEGVWMIGPDRCTTEVNQRMCDLVGYTREEFLGRNPVEFADEENSRIFEEKARIVPNRQTRTYEIALRHRDGHNIRTEFRATNLFNEDGSVMGVLAFVADLTVRKQAEAKLHLAANVFSHAREGIIITDASGTIIDVNEAFTRITGYGREEALGQNPRILKSGRQDKAFYESMWRDLVALGHWSGESWNRHKDGGVYAELLTISAVRDAAGAVQQYVGLFSDITAIKEHQSQLEHFAHFDMLTNLPNRVLLADRLQQAMAQAQRRSQQLAVVYLDLDGFKAINDRHSHAAGDQVLIALARRMKQALREGDSLARLGGDEFVAVLIDLEDQAACLPLLNRLLAACAQSVQVGELSLQVSASLGVTFYPQAQEIDPDQLLRQADQAMYQAKVAGKNRYHFFDAEQDSSIRGHHESLERIRLALEKREFVLHYQPKVNMRTGQIIGAEALIRWQHPEKGLLAPAVFLPVIEDHALAVSIGEWVIDAALTQIELWRAAGLDLRVSVNVGARQLQQSDFVDRLKSILAKHPKVKSGELELEVLETSALEDIAQVSQVIEACAQIGVMFALDDFGTGYSSLTYLKRLRVQVLKIDQSFVRDMLEDPDDLAILQGIIGMAAAFRREVIAEGVETIEHGSLLLQLGCELAQGYGIARPMPAQQMSAWAAQWQPAAAWYSLWRSVPTDKGLNGIERRSKANERRIVAE